MDIIDYPENKDRIDMLYIVYGVDIRDNGEFYNYRHSFLNYTFLQEEDIDICVAGLKVSIEEERDNGNPSAFKIYSAIDNIDWTYAESMLGLDPGTYSRIYEDIISGSYTLNNKIEHVKTIEPDGEYNDEY